MELEEVQLIENPQVLPVINPPADPEYEEDLSDSEDIQENPNIKGMAGSLNTKVKEFTGGVGIISMAVGAVGVVASIVIPKVIKWNTGWKDLVATAVTAALGGFVLGRWDKSAMVAFVIAAGGVFLLKFVKWAMMGFKNEPILLDDLTNPGVQPILGDGGFEFEDFEAGPIYDVADAGLFDVGQAEDLVHPTSGIDDFY